MTPEGDAIAEVTAANERFYRAFESLDIEQMAGAWVQDETAQVVHPGWTLKSGWEDVRESWAVIFRNTGYMEFHLTGVHVLVSGPWARVTCTENLRSVSGGQESMGQVQATNVYTLQGDRWLMVHHHGSPIFTG